MPPQSAFSLPSWHQWWSLSSSLSFCFSWTMLSSSDLERQDPVFNGGAFGASSLLRLVVRRLLPTVCHESSCRLPLGFVLCEVRTMLMRAARKEESDRSVAPLALGRRSVPVRPTNSFRRFRHTSEFGISTCLERDFRPRSGSLFLRLFLPHGAEDIRASSPFARFLSGAFSWDKPWHIQALQCLFC